MAKIQMVRKLKMQPEATTYDIQKKKKKIWISNCFLSETMKARNCERNIIKGELGRKNTTQKQSIQAKFSILH